MDGDGSDRRAKCSGGGGLLRGTAEKVGGCRKSFTWWLSSLAGFNMTFSSSKESPNTTTTETEHSKRDTARHNRPQRCDVGLVSSNGRRSISR